jgi:hypothetical protein
VRIRQTFAFRPSRLVLETAGGQVSRIGRVNRQLAAIVRDVETAQERLERFAHDTHSRTWNTRPAPGQWSPAECIAHLNLCSAAILPVVRAAIAAASRQPGRASHYRRDALGWIVSHLVAPSGGVKLKTAARFEPAPEHDVPTLLREFARHQAELVACVRAADGLPIDRITVVSPFDARLSYNLYAALTLVPRHQHRHLLQAERAAEAPLPLVSAFAI